jgi:hypothetical protein
VELDVFGDESHRRKGGVIVPLSVSYKHFGREREEEIGEVVIFDLEQIDADPVLAASATEVNGATVMMGSLRSRLVGDHRAWLQDPPRRRSHRRAARRPAFRTLRRPVIMTTQDREIRQAVESDGGLEDHFIEATVRVLDGAGIGARYDFPGCLFFDALGREWATAYTGLHVNDNEGYGDEFPGDERLVALESRGTLSVGEYADTLLAVIEDARAAATA